REIRDHTLRMMHRKNKRSPLPQQPTEDELKLYEVRGIRGPEETNFRVWLESNLGRPWNKRAAEVFAKSFRIRNGKMATREELEKRFIRHLYALQKQRVGFKQDKTPKEQQKERDRATANGRRTRQSGLGVRRVQGGMAHPDTAELTKWLAKLPISCMSGDESDHKDGKISYVVPTLIWRSDEFTHLLLVLDDLQLSTHWTSYDKPAAGNFPHDRIRSDRVDTNAIVPVGLPINCYHVNYRAILTPHEKKRLKMKSPIDLTVSKAALE
ncbi:hypothetical protein BV25DRAFT_1817251, partial [Artomyces pyxidatus]